MYLTPLLTLITQALRKTFDGDYLNPDFRNLRVGLEFPIERIDYPGVWVDFESAGDVTRAGVAHLEYSDAGATGRMRAYTRYRFGGYVVYTVVALSSLERARLYDELVRIVAFGSEAAQTRTFRNLVENNDLIAVGFDFDRVSPRGSSEVQGTPWGTDEMIYEISLAVQVIGECVNDPVTGSLVPLSRIDIYPYHDGERDPATISGNPLAPPESWQ